MNRKQITASRVGGIVLSVLALLIGILSWNYLRFSSRQEKPGVIAALNLVVDPILERFKEAIQILTVSTHMSRIGNDSELYRFRDYLQESFPNLHTSP